MLLAVPTDDGIAALSFAIGADGRLAQLDNDPSERLLCGKERELLLPINLLDNLRAVGDSTEAIGGTIVGMSRSMDDDSADRVRIQVSKADKAAVGKLASGDTVNLSNTTSYNGCLLYTSRCV